jgi:hypothetical protein
VLVARAAFPKGNLYLSMRDELGTLFDQHFASSQLSERGNASENKGFPVFRVCKLNRTTVSDPF